ncbi:MAG: hypothetical protein AAGU75_15625 [Bacillota bacterium]
MGEDMKQCLDRDRCDRFDRDRCDREPIHDDCECRDHDDNWNWGDWLPILIIVFLLCGGTNIFGGGFGCSRSDSCDDNGFGGSWLLILVLIFFFFGNQRGGKDGFFGGLFG